MTSSPALISHRIAASSVACVHDVVSRTPAESVFSFIQLLHICVYLPSPQIFPDAMASFINSNSSPTAGGTLKLTMFLLLIPLHRSAFPMHSTLVYIFVI